MKAEDLRIGNYVNRLGYDFYNDSIFPDGTKELETVNINILRSILNGNDDLTQGCYKPIPLTEEWLLNFGFVKEIIGVKKFVYLNHDKLRILFVDGKIETGILGVSQYHFIRHKLEFVHQLQNLYFALTGEELTITI